VAVWQEVIPFSLLFCHLLGPFFVVLAFSFVLYLFFHCICINFFLLFFISALYLLF